MGVKQHKPIRFRPTTPTAFSTSTFLNPFSHSPFLQRYSFAKERRHYSKTAPHFIIYPRFLSIQRLPPDVWRCLELFSLSALSLFSKVVTHLDQKIVAHNSRDPPPSLLSGFLDIFFLFSISTRRLFFSVILPQVARYVCKVWGV